MISNRLRPTRILGEGTDGISRCAASQLMSGAIGPTTCAKPLPGWRRRASCSPHHGSILYSPAVGGGDIFRSLLARGTAVPELLIVDGAPSLEKAVNVVFREKFLVNAGK
jgi:hypothetical protein